MIWQTLGGIGHFLLGMMLMFDGLKALSVHEKAPRCGAEVLATGSD